MLEEAEELATLFLAMLFAIPLRKKKPNRADLVDWFKARVNGVGDLFDACLLDSPDREAIQRRLAKVFAETPGLPERLWSAAEQALKTDWPRPFWLVLRQELNEISRRRSGKDPADENYNLYTRAAELGLVGLAFSGGGHRSAPDNRGVLQAVAQFGLWPRVDSPAPVSGGGYIGGWFAAWLYRKKLGPSDIRERLAPDTELSPQDPELKPIHFLRQFSNYLTPVLGFFSFDTWTMASVYLRNVILNQLTLISAFGALLILPRLMGALVRAEEGWPATADLVAAVVAASLMILAVTFVAKYIGAVTSKSHSGWRVGESGAPSDRSSFAAGASSGTAAQAHAAKPESAVPVHTLCIWPLLAAVLIAAHLFWKHKDDGALQGLTQFWFLVPALLFFGALSFLISWRGGFVDCYLKRLASPTYKELYGLLTLITALSAGVGVLLLRGYVVLLQAFGAQSGSGIWHATVWGPPALLAVVALTGVLQVGLMGIDFPDSGREWLSRFRAMTNVYTFFWLALFCASIYGPWIIARLGVWATGLGTVWFATTVAAIRAGTSKRSGETKEGAPTLSIMDVIARLGPPVFLVGFILLVSCGVHLVLTHPVLEGSYSLSHLLSCYWDALNWPLNLPAALWHGGDWTVAAPLVLLGVFLATGAILAWRVDINEFSMHHFYKNRLARCYLGASNFQRKPDGLTGFDENDDVPITSLRPGEHYRGPYPIVNATLNLSTGDQLAWQERKATSFTFTPCYSGFHLPRETDAASAGTKMANLKPCAYRKTKAYATRGGIKLGTAIAISGAAADPNQGYNTSPAVAFLMTVFDVRLGWWLGNPRKDKECKLSSPRFGLAALISELFGQTDDRSNFVSLSDGGHFDNMGLYELVRRRCKYVVLCDAEQDGAFKFGGLGMAIRKCRIDFGAEIDIDPKRIIPLEAGKRSEAHCAVGTITYRDGEKGILLYIKSSLTGDEPEDVLQYAAGKSLFPHESTGDQWFTESQFESYRKLGHHAAWSALEPAGKWLAWHGDDPNISTCKLFEALKNYWYPINPSLRLHATKHTATLNELFDKLRADSRLHALGSRLFPNAIQVMDPQASDPAAEYFFCMTLIQLVEDIYFDFELDHDRWCDDPRIGGWMTIFKTWAGVPQVNSTWEAGKTTFREDFQLFWNKLRAMRGSEEPPPVHR